MKFVLYVCTFTNVFGLEYSDEKIALDKISFIIRSYENSNKMVRTKRNDITFHKLRVPSNANQITVNLQKRTRKPKNGNLRGTKKRSYSPKGKFTEWKNLSGQRR